MLRCTFLRAACLTKCVVHLGHVFRVMDKPFLHEPTKKRLLNNLYSVPSFRGQPRPSPFPPYFPFHGCSLSAVQSPVPQTREEREEAQRALEEQMARHREQLRMQLLAQHERV